MLLTPALELNFTAPIRIVLSMGSVFATFRKNGRTILVQKGLEDPDPSMINMMSTSGHVYLAVEAAVVY